MCHVFSRNDVESKKSVRTLLLSLFNIKKEMEKELRAFKHFAGGSLDEDGNQKHFYFCLPSRHTHNYQYVLCLVCVCDLLHNDEAPYRVITAGCAAGAQEAVW